MKKILSNAILLIGLASPLWCNSQPQSLTDPFDDIFKREAQRNPNFQADLKAHQLEIAAKASHYEQVSDMFGYSRGTRTNRTIPVVFHIVLTPAQVTQMGGTSAIIARVHSQLATLNADFNAKNADSTNIPSAFRPLYANVNLQFALAVKNPQGQPTVGYEFVTTSKNDFDANGSGTMGSKYFCSDVKYAASGGAGAWDPKKYLNVWVTNISPAGVGGVGTPPPYPVYGGTSQFPWDEQGVVLLYSALGKRVSPSDYFFSPTVELGRTLVHELGHFFNLFHPFGISTMNNASCQDDDGVTDTPPQAGPTQSYCPVFPLTDGCSPNLPGVMYVNHMDYESQSCALMFSKGQRARIYVETEAAGGYRYELLEHPELTSSATTGIAASKLSAGMVIFPNPASGQFNISFNEVTEVSTVEIINSLGQISRSIGINRNSKTIVVGINNLQVGYYTVRCITNNGVFNKALTIQ